MGFFARLKHGSKYITLSSGTYCVTDGFVPPPPSPTPLLTGGNMLNKYAGGRRVDRSFSDRMMNVPLVITGDSEAEVNHAARRLAAFIENAMLDSSDPLYFVFGESDAIPRDPKWGQQFKYYEIKDATQAIGNLYMVIRDAFAFVNLPLLVGPFAVGQQQRVGSATGSMFEHTIATPDGISRGLSIPGAITNEVPNPIFGHSTWSTSWTIGGDITATENTDKEYILFGASSAKLTASGATNRYFRCSVDCAASTTFFSVYVKRPNGTSPDSIMSLYYDGNLITKTVRAIGDGWYWVYASETGTGAAANFSIWLTEGYTIYIDGVQAAVKALPTMPCIYGDLLDASWVSTSHNSDSSSTASRLRVPTSDIIDMDRGTVRIVWMPHIDNDEYVAQGTSTLFEDDSGFKAYYAPGTTDFRFTDGTNTADSGAFTFSAFEPIVLHFTWSKTDGIDIYTNGSANGNAVFTVPTISNYFYIGSSTTPSERIHGTFLDFTTFTRTLTATDVLNDYTNISQHVTGGDGYGQRLNPIPWLWTDDGDDVLENYYDSTHENFCVSGGIPGNVPADTILYFNPSDNNQDLVVSNFPANIYFDMTDLFTDKSGHADAGALGGAVTQSTVNTTVTNSSAATLAYDDYSINYRIKELANNKITIYTSLSDAGSNLLGATKLLVGGYVIVEGEYRNISADGTRRTFVTYSLPFPKSPSDMYEWLQPSTNNMIVYLALKRTTGSDTVEVDYNQVMVGDFCLITATSGYVSTILLREGKADGYFSIWTGALPVEGDPIRFYPNKLNHMSVNSGDIGAATDRTMTTTLSRIYIVPRWSIL